MKENILQGTITAIVTPFKEDMTIDFDAFKKLIDFQIDSGVDAILVCGSTGESATLSEKEKVALITQAVEYSAGRVPIIAGTGSNSTESTLAMTTLAKELNADAVLLVAPYYNKPSQEGLYNHFLTIAENVDIPQIIYNVPGRTSVNIFPETQLRLAETAKNIIGTKEASGDLEQIMEIIRNAPKGFNVVSGDDMITLSIIQLGGNGVISVLSNYAGKDFSKMVNLALAGKYDEAREIHYKLFDLMQLNFIETNPAPVKSALALMKLIDENLRLPLLPVLPQSKDKMKKALKKAGIIKK